MFLLGRGFIALAVTAAAAHADLRCERQPAAAIPIVRPEGLTELIGDIVLNCTSTGPGDTVGLTGLFNTSLTSRILPDGSSEARLLIDEPPTGGVPASVLEGTPVGGRAVAFPVFEFTPGPHRLRFVNLRASAADIVGSLPRFDGPKQMTFRPFQRNRDQDAAGVFLGTPLTDGFAVARIEPQRLLVFNVFNPFGGLHCQPSPTTPQRLTLTFGEGFPSAFRQRGAPATSANPFPVPGPQASAAGESGFIQGSGPAGLADFGARLAARFENVPAGVRLFAATSNLTTGGAPPSAFFVPDLTGPATPPPAGRLFEEIPVVNGTGVAVWEVINQPPNGTLNFEVYPQWTAGGELFNSPRSGTSFVTGFFGPTSLDGPGASAPIPRFVDTPQPRFPFLTLGSCNGDAPSFFSSFDTGLAIPGPGLPVISDGRWGDYFTAGPDGTPIPPRPDQVLSVFPDTRPISGLSLRLGANTVRQATVNWLTADLTGTQTPAAVRMSVNAAGLDEGVYQGSVTVAGETPARTQPLNVPVVLTVDRTSPRFGPFGVANVGSYSAGSVAPGEAVAVFGERFGPATLTTTTAVNGQLPTVAAETRVLFDGVAAPMLYASNGVAAVMVPFAVASRTSAQVQVEYRGRRSPAVSVPVRAAIPGLLTADSSGFGQGAILNQDFSVNGPSNGAAPGEVVQIYGTGSGQTNPAGRDGAIYVAPLPTSVLQFSVTIDGRPAVVQYGGPAPSLPHGVFQVNAVVPEGTRRGRSVPVVVTAGTQRTQPGVFVAIRP